MSDRTFVSLTAEGGLRRGNFQVLDLNLAMDFYPGVACITLAFVDEAGAPISLALWPPSSPGSPDALREEEFEQLTQVIRCPVVLDSSSGGRSLTKVWGSQSML